ncbi:MAG: protein-ADP-ribose hydrolase [Lachnospiraceae bacterium]
MKVNNSVDCLLNKLREDSADYKNIKTGDYSLPQKKIAIRSLMNIRMPGNVSDELLQLQDQYLQEELLQKGIVDLLDIPTIREQYNAQSPFAEKISLWQGDITRLNAGAIVNAANSQMLGCFVPCHGCVDNAIHSAAGMQLRNACNHIMNQRRIRYGIQYKEPTGTATLTKAYNLPCDYVIHTVGPIVCSVLSDELRRELRNCYESVLKCCVENEIKSVAFCCISTGEFHFPNDEAAEIASETVIDFLENNDNMERIIFNVFKDSDRKIYEKILGLNEPVQS